ncbi:Protein of unknown function [Pseudorhodobacter antarcticus]|uniref:DUF2852 domain-containing protein n=1 Tax=Pseudorhodobacter antarcticus TaxID=1077947 RepID=A0A1H8DMF9_9RHOB|nr:DUF2852 domain-containing protein [Pseudorhodobacter antarcticus]SEN08459.1 Protein of unknown function [Pseudorhodobacter antarcticus]
MYTSPSDSYPTTGIMTWPRRVEGWLDARGRLAWIAVMVVGFVIAGPLGLGILAYMLWTKKFSGCGAARRDRAGYTSFRFGMQPSTGNSAFDAYRTDTIKRLEEEQAAFEAFLKRLRDAKDKQEFDSFMDDRAKANRSTEADLGAAKEIAAY